MDNTLKDLQSMGLSLYGISTVRNRVRLEELVGDKERWKDITAAAASMAGRDVQYWAKRFGSIFGSFRCDLVLDSILLWSIRLRIRFCSTWFGSRFYSSQLDSVQGFTLRLGSDQDSVLPGRSLVLGSSLIRLASGLEIRF